MFKRVIWLGVGVAAGSASTLWGQRKVKSKVEELASKASAAHVIDVAKDTAESLVGSVRSAVVEGKAAMVEAEHEMRAARDVRSSRPSNRKSGVSVEPASVERKLRVVGGSSSRSASPEAR